MSAAPGSRATTSLLMLCAVLLWFNTGIEAVRTASWDDLKAHPEKVLWPPWNLLRAYVSREGDDHLYFEYSKLALGQPADLAYVARRRHLSPEQLLQEVRPGSGLRLPYRDFPFEYPPLPLLAMLAPRLLSDALPTYRLAFGGLMALLALGTALMGMRLWQGMAAGHGEPAARRLAWLVLAIGPILVSRFDVLPAFLTAGALLLWSTGRPLRAGLVLGLAAMTKLYPALLLLPWAAPLLAHGRHGLRETVRLAVGVLLGALSAALPFLVACPGPFVGSVLLYGARPFQVESLVGGLLLTVGGRGATLSSFGSDNVVAPELLLRAWSLVLPALLGTLALLAFLQERREPTRDPRSRLARACAFTASALTCILCGSKVLSPQFLLWLLPVVALLPGERGAGVWRLAVAAGVLTQAFYPYLYEAVTKAHPIPLTLLMLRNGALVATALAAARAARAIPAALSEEQPATRQPMPHATTGRA